MHLRRKGCGRTRTSLSRSVRLDTGGTNGCVGHTLTHFRRGGLENTVDSCSLTLSVSPGGFLKRCGHNLLHTRINSSGQTVRSFSFILGVRPSGVVTAFGHNLLHTRAKSCQKTVDSCSGIVTRCPGFVTNCCRHTRTHGGVNSRGKTRRSRFGVVGVRVSGHGNISSNSGGRNSSDGSITSGSSRGSGKSNKGAHGGSSGGVRGCQGVMVTSSSRTSRHCGDSCHKHMRSQGIAVGLRPVCTLACCRGLDSIGHVMRCRGCVRRLGRSGLFPGPLHVAGVRTPLARRRMHFRFTLVSTRASSIITSRGGTGGHFVENLSFCLIRSFTDSVSSFAGDVLLSSAFFPTCFVHTLIHCGRLRCGGTRTAVDRNTASNAARVGGPRIATVSCRIIGGSLSRIVLLTPSFICNCCGHNGISSLLGSCHTTLTSCSGTVRLDPSFTRTCFGHKLARVFLKGGGRNVTSLDGTKRLNVISTCGVVGEFASAQRWRFFTGG